MVDIDRMSRFTLYYTEFRNKNMIQGVWSNILDFLQLV